jgi:hypothetical protein
MQFERFCSLNDIVVGSFPHLHHLGFQPALPNLGKPLSGGIVYWLLILLSVRYFVKVVLPLDNTEVVVVPNAPPNNLPGLPSLPTLGTVAHDVDALAEKNDDAGLQLRINAMVERERLEDNGIGDELMEMQVMLWPIEHLIAKDFAIDMLFEYEEDDGSTLMWCQGKVVDFFRESKDKHVFVKIEWSDKCVREGDLKITKNQLKKMKWNPSSPVGV